MVRVILFTGKGGVGKTSISAATALRCAELGHKTIVVSTDPAHSLSDSLNIQLNEKPLKIKKNLYAQEIDTQKEMEENWGMVQHNVATLLEARGMDDVVAEELAIIPGLEELFSLMEIKDHLDSKIYDVIIVDSAPTGSSLRLLNFPDVLSWYVRNIFNLSNTTKKIIQGASKMMGSTNGSVLGMVDSIYNRIDGLRDILLDRKKTTIRIVVNPEKMVINEAKRGYTYLNLFGLAVDGIFVNKILPPDIKDNYFAKWREIQAKHLTYIDESFKPLPIFKVHLFDEELVGEKMLQKFTEALYKKKDPASVFFNDTPVDFKTVGDKHLLKIKLPFTDKKNIDLLHRGDELVIRVNTYKHSLILPQSLIGKPVKEAKFVEDKLHITFGGDKNVSKKR